MIKKPLFFIVFRCYGIKIEETRHEQYTAIGRFWLFSGRLRFFLMINKQSKENRIIFKSHARPPYESLFGWSPFLRFLSLETVEKSQTSPTGQQSRAKLQNNYTTSYYTTSYYITSYYITTYYNFILHNFMLQLHITLHLSQKKLHSEPITTVQ